MNASFFRTIALTGAVLSSTFALSVIAGPGPQYWFNAEKTASDQTTTTAAGTCPGSTLVPVTVMTPSWSNGKGPIAETQIGTKRVCTICPVTGVKTVQAANGRGPSSTATTVAAGAQHDCTAGCPAAVKS
jgi:hypothetical protein